MNLISRAKMYTILASIMALTLILSQHQGVIAKFMESLLFDVVELVSINTSMETANSYINSVSINSDGQFIAFHTNASNLVTGINGTYQDIFVKDMSSGVIEIISIANTGGSGHGHSTDPSISANGRYVTFLSQANDLVVGDVNGQQDIFLFDRDLDTVSLVSVAADGITQANGGSSAPKICGNGSHVVFSSLASNLVPDDTNNFSDVFIKDLTTGTIERISTASDGTTQGNDISDRPEVSSDCRYVAFRSRATNLVSTDTNGRYDIFRKDRTTGITTLVSVAADGTSQTDNNSEYMAISDDGGMIAFESSATNLVLGDSNNTADIFVKNIDSGSVTLVSFNTSGQSANGDSHFPSISGNGSIVAFHSGATDIIAGDENGSWDVFVYDLEDNTTTLVSQTNGGTQANSHSMNPAISNDGTVVAFLSYANNLNPSDTDSNSDVYKTSFATPPLTTPTLTAPIDNSNTDNPTPTFDWENVSDATGYILQYSTDEAFTNPIEEIVIESTFTPTTDLVLGEWFWRIKATGDAPESNWSSIWSFTITPPLTDHFVITVTGSSFIIPTVPSETYNYNVDCDNDGLDDASGQTEDFNCTYTDEGPHTIRIKDNTGTGNGFPQIYFYNAVDNEKLLSIEQWGAGHWTSMENAFHSCTNLIVNATDAPDLSGVSSIHAMFAYASSLNQPIGHWNTTNVKDMSGAFYEATAFNQDISAWDVSNVTNMQAMFYNANAFNQDISGWITSNVITMQGMFTHADVFNQDISNWITTNVTNMSSMFNNAFAFNQNIGIWNTEKVTTTQYMFYGANSFNQNLGGWNVTSLQNADQMFWETSLDRENYDALLIGWGAQALYTGVPFGFGPTYCSGETSRQQMVDIFGWVIADDGMVCTVPTDDFVITVQTDNTGNTANNQFLIPTNGGNYNVDCNNDGIVEVTGHSNSYTCEFETPGTYTIRIINNAVEGDGFPFFAGSIPSDPLKILSVDQWGTMKWTSMNSAFQNASNLVINAIDAPNLNNVTDMDDMFYGASSMNSDFNHWDVSNVTTMQNMFTLATSFNGNITGWNTGNVTDMSSMFYEATSFNQDISKWNIENVTSLGYMFSNAISFNQDISGWNTSSVTTMDGVFQGTTSFDQNLGAWNVESLQSAIGMFRYVTLSPENYESLLIGWNNQMLIGEVIFNAGNSTFCSPEAETARQNMIDTDRWSIFDGGKVCPVDSPILISPVNDSFIYDQTPTFNWSDVTGATGYILQYADNDQFSEMVEILVTESTFTPSTDLALSEWFWQVKPTNGSFEGSWSSMNNFNIIEDPFWLHEFGYGDGWENPETPRTAADVNGDGFNDLIGFSSVGVRVALGTGTSFNPSTQWSNGFGSDPAAGGWGGVNTIRTVADVNGDGMADIVGFGNYGVMVSLSNGTFFENPTYWIYGFGSDPAAGGWSSTDHNRVVKDVNGDGMDDVVGYGSYGVLVSISTGTSFEPAEYWAWGYGRDLGDWDGLQNPRTIADINGDGCGDIIGFSNWGVLVSLSQACEASPEPAFGVPIYWAYGYAYQLGGWDSTRHIRTFSDVDGDGDEDLIGFGDGGVVVSPSNGYDALDESSYWILGYGYINGGWDVNQHPRSVADVNGDGMGDIVGYATAGVLIELSDGTQFE